MTPIDAVCHWYRVRDVASMLQRSPKTVRRLLRSYRDECRVAREGKHPRRVLYIPETVVAKLSARVLR